MTRIVVIGLRDAGVIVNDNIAQANGTLVLLPAVIDQDERVMITLIAKDRGWHLKLRIPVEADHRSGLKPISIPVWSKNSICLNPNLVAG